MGERLLSGQGRGGRRWSDIAYGKISVLKTCPGKAGAEFRGKTIMTTTKGTLALLIHGGTENWSPARWKKRFDEVCADRPVWLATEGGGDPDRVHYAAVWKPVPGELASFPNLKVIFNLGAGVDALMADKTLPDVPLVRVAVNDLTDRMAEYVVLHVLMHHRQELYLRDSQRAKRWAPRSQWPANAITVGIMGLGVLGANAADVQIG